MLAVEELTGLTSPALPPDAWRRQAFPSISSAVDTNGPIATTQEIYADLDQPGGLPSPATVVGWQTNVRSRYNATASNPLAPPDTVSPPVTQACELTLVQESYGWSEVQSQSTDGVTATFPAMLQVTVWGFEPAELTIPMTMATAPFGTLKDQPSVTTRVPAVTFTNNGSPEARIVATPASVSPDPNGYQSPPGVPVPFTFYYDVEFNDFSIFNFNVETMLTIGVQATFAVDASFTNDASLILVKSTDPQFYGDVYQGLTYLSDELKVGQFKASDSAFGHTVGNDPLGWLGKVLASMNADANSTDPSTVAAVDDWFDQSLAEDEYQSWLNLMSEVPTDPSDPASPLEAVYNFAFARVHLQGLAQADNVRVFFRMFPANSTGTFYTDQYYMTVPTAHGPPEGSPGLISVPGIGYGGQADQYVSIPFYAEARVPVTDPLTEQGDNTNVNDIPPGVSAPQAGQIYEAYFGCWLDINQPQETYVPMTVPSNVADQSGPFGAYDPVSPLAWMSGLHQCIVAEISFTGIAIPYGANPGTVSWLVQRNVVWTPTAAS
jgi:hypothetical protein